MLKPITSGECWRYFVDKRFIFYFVLYQCVKVYLFGVEEMERKDKQSNV